MYASGTHRNEGPQSKQTGAAEPPAFVQASTLFQRAEREIDLLGRSAPRNDAAELERWALAYARGQTLPFELRHGPAAKLGALRTELESARRELADRGPLGGLYAARAEELELEAELAEWVGAPAFASVARRRHAPRSGPEWKTAEELARLWSTPSTSRSSGSSRTDSPAPGAELEARSDDDACPHSLLRILGREVGRLRLPVRISISRSLATRAAVGDGVIYVKSGLLLSRDDAERIALHEVYGHALPRCRALSQCIGLMRVGSAGASDDEEGRALLLEERAGRLDVERRRELALRHRAALAVSDGADATACVRLLESLGCPIRRALALYTRVARGPGLCRELEYIPAWSRVRTAFELDPALEPWLAHGRLSLHAARTLRGESVPLDLAPHAFSTCQSRAGELPSRGSD